MVEIKRGKKKWDYKNDCMETVKIDKKIKEAFTEFCNKKSIIKGKLIENFYRSVLIKFRDGSLSASNGYVTFNIFSGTIKITQPHK
jgi:hypothetical protein